MQTDELAEELADFWFSAIEGAGWEDRLRILREVDAQLSSDIPERSAYEVVCPRFFAAVIKRLGMPTIENEAQATIYSFSAVSSHREAAHAWFERAPGEPSPGFLPAMRGDRRRFPRQFLGATSEVWVRGQATPCRLLDLSEGGARVLLQQQAPLPGTLLQLSLPDAGVRDAMVVFQNDAGVGLRFANQPGA